QSTLRKWFVSTVARALDPGCEAGPMLLLCGSQGIGKSTFFDILGVDWFSDTRLEMTNRGEITSRGGLQLAYSWIYEWPNFEAVITRQTVGAVRASPAAPHDRFRPPYGRKVIEHPRSTTIVGTISDETILDDTTEPRR